MFDHIIFLTIVFLTVFRANQKNPGVDCTLAYLEARIFVLIIIDYIQFI